MADPPADPGQLPPRVHRAFIVTFVTGLIQLLPAALITYFLVGLSVLTYGSWHVDGNLDFLSNGNPSNSPIVRRRAVPRIMVLYICVFTIAFLLLDLQCIFAVVIGFKGIKKASAERVENRARRITRMATFISYVMLPATSMVLIYCVWAAVIPAIVAAAAMVLLTVLQFFALSIIRKYTTTVKRRIPRERTILAMSFLLLLVLLLQLFLTPIIAGTMDTDLAWDSYSLGVEVIQGIGAVLSGISALIGLYLVLGNFLNNSDSFAVYTHVTHTIKGPVLTHWKCNSHSLLPCIWTTKGAGKAWVGYRVCIALNMVVIIIGVIMTAAINGVMFKRNDQDLGKQNVFWAAFEQPLTSFLVLLGASVLEFLTSRICAKTAPYTED